MAHKTGHADKDAFEYEESTHFGRSSDERSSLRVIVFSFIPNIYGERHHIKQRIIENRHKRWCFFPVCDFQRILEALFEHNDL